MGLTHTSGNTVFGNPTLHSYHHECDCGLVFKSVVGWMQHISQCPHFVCDCAPADQVQDCPRLEVIPTPREASRMDALEYAARLAVTDSTLYNGKAYGRIHEVIREG